MRFGVHELEPGTIAESTVDQPARSRDPDHVLRTLRAAQEPKISTWLAIFVPDAVVR
jgi:hypothetical protein